MIHPLHHAVRNCKSVKEMEELYLSLPEWGRETLVYNAVRHRWREEWHHLLEEIFPDSGLVASFPNSIPELIIEFNEASYERFLMEEANNLLDE